MRKGICFDELIRHRVNRFLIIDLFIRRQRQKKYNIFRQALQNKTIENIHKIYNFEISKYISYQGKDQYKSFYIDTISLDPNTIAETKSYTDSCNDFETEYDTEFEDIPLCFIDEEREHGYFGSVNL